MLIQTDNRTRGRPADAVDAHAEPPRSVKLLRRLQVFALGDRLFFIADEPWFDSLQLLHEVGDFDHQIAYDREIAKRLDSDRSRLIRCQKSRAGQLWIAVDHHPATAAD